MSSCTVTVTLYISAETAAQLADLAEAPTILQDETGRSLSAEDSAAIIKDVIAGKRGTISHMPEKLSLTV